MVIPLVKCGTLCPATPHRSWDAHHSWGCAAAPAPRAPEGKGGGQQGFSVWRFGGLRGGGPPAPDQPASPASYSTIGHASRELVELHRAHTNVDARVIPTRVGVSAPPP